MKSRESPYFVGDCNQIFWGSNQILDLATVVFMVFMRRIQYPGDQREMLGQEPHLKPRLEDIRLFGKQSPFAQQLCLLIQPFMVIE